MSEKMFIMGRGDMLVGHGTVGACPAISLCPVPDGVKGTVKTDASEHMEYMRENGITIVFTSAESIEHFIGTLEKAVDSALKKAEDEKVTS